MARGHQAEDTQLGEEARVLRVHVMSMDVDDGHGLPRASGVLLEAMKSNAPPGVNEFP
jgi:hypothetical protein